jgi:possible restriction modification system DNA specificity subunit (fragment)
MKIFLDVMYDDTKNARKIKSCDYNHEGKYPIIDQSSKNVIGYTDEIDGLYNDVPVIIFGDHTRRFKLVEEPFFIGADGTKVLKLRSSVYDYKFIYYYLLHKKIPDTGYNRHFKWVKELEFPEIPRSIQSDIVKKLEVLNDLISSKNKLLESFDILIKSRFDELIIGDKCDRLMFNDLFFCTTGKLDSNAAIKGGRYPFFTCAKEIFYINDYAFDQEALLLAGNNAAGKYDVKYYNGKFNAYQRTYVLSLRKKGIYSIFKKQLEDKLEYLQSQSKGSTTRYLTMGILKKLTFCVPDMEIQLKLDKEIQQINKLKSDVQKSIDETQLLMDSLMQEYFG